MGYEPNWDHYRIKVGKNALDARRAVPNVFDHHADAQPLFNQFPGHGAAFRDQFEIFLRQREANLVQTSKQSIRLLKSDKHCL